MDRLDAVVVGAGVVGLAAARALALSGREVVILEAEDAIGTHGSSRNSEVIHAGIYYPRDSLKARSCVAGNRRLYEYCVERGIPHLRCGKLIVAADEAQISKLREIQSKALENGVTDVVWMAREQARALEPQLDCAAALYSPSTGIIDSHALMLAYLGDAETNGAVLALKSVLNGAVVTDRGMELHVNENRFLTKILVNSAGLTAPSVARRIGGMPQDLVPGQYYAKGNYYSLAGRAPFSRLVYPVPEPGGLGVHVTLDLAGCARFGPDVEWVERVEYSVAGAARRRARARLLRHPPENRRPRRASRRFRDPGAARARRARPGQPVRHRVARIDSLAGVGRSCRRLPRELIREEIPK